MPTDPLNRPWEAHPELIGHIAHVFGGDGDAVITVPPHVLHDQVAIARLVAAAPDLLEAARYARALIEAGLALQVLDPTQLVLSPDGDYELEWAEALEQLKAAIERAALAGGETGETE